jgi:hypothetical protein
VDEWEQQVSCVADRNTHGSRQGQAGVQGLVEQQSRLMTPINEPVAPPSSPPHLCHALQPLYIDARVRRRRNPSSLPPAFPVLTAAVCSTRHQHASSTCAPASSSSNSSQCNSHRVLDPPATRHNKPVACICHNPALLARRDAPVYPPHCQIVPRKAQAGYWWCCA